MYLEIAESDVIILSIAAACLVAAVLLEMLRVILPDLYQWVADHAKVQAEIKTTKRALAATLDKNREMTAVRDRRSAERFRLKSQLSRTEMTLAGLERDRVEVWHELGDPGVGENLYVARVGHRMLADRSQKDFDSAPSIWRYGNAARIWAGNDRSARARLQAAFPAADGYSTGEPTLVMSARATPDGGGAPRGDSRGERIGR
jgi:hypothetical protein